MILRALLIIGSMLAVMPAHSELQIEVTQGADDAVKIAVVPFDWRGRGALSTPPGSHPCEGRDPLRSLSRADIVVRGPAASSMPNISARDPVNTWVPAFAGMTAEC